MDLFLFSAPPPVVSPSTLLLSPSPFNEVSFFSSILSLTLTFSLSTLLLDCWSLLDVAVDFESAVPVVSCCISTSTPSLPRPFVANSFSGIFALLVTKSSLETLSSLIASLTLLLSLDGISSLMILSSLPLPPPPPPSSPSLFLSSFTEDFR